MFKVGQKVIGYWGAMHPYSYGKIVEWNADESRKYVAHWNDGSKFHGKIADIQVGEPMSSGVGIYFAGEDDGLDEWFEEA